MDRRDLNAGVCPNLLICLSLICLSLIFQSLWSLLSIVSRMIKHRNWWYLRNAPVQFFYIIVGETESQRHWDLLWACALWGSLLSPLTFIFRIATTIWYYKGVCYECFQIFCQEKLRWGNWVDVGFEVTSFFGTLQDFERISVVNTNKRSGAKDS